MRADALGNVSQAGETWQVAPERARPSAALGSCSVHVRAWGSKAVTPHNCL